jgi:FAD/FMN-containing dehydrogenase
MAPMLAVGNPLLHGVGEMPYPALQGFFDPLYPPGHQWYWRADFVRELSDDAIERHVEFGEKMPAGQSTMHLYPIDGAVHDVASSDTAFSYRDVNFAEVIVGVDPDPANAEAITRWTVEYWEATHPFSAGGAYVNFMMDEGQDRVKATYGANYDRLTRVKAKYDPKNLFKVNQNIQPA